MLQNWHRLCENTKLNDLRKNICLRKSEVSVERLSVCNVIENLAEYSWPIDLAECSRP